MSKVKWEVVTDAFTGAAFWQATFPGGIFASVYANGRYQIKSVRRTSDGMIQRQDMEAILSLKPWESAGEREVVSATQTYCEATAREWQEEQRRQPPAPSLEAERAALIEERGALINERAELDAERAALEEEADAATRRAAELEAERNKARADFAELSLVLRDGFEKWEAEKLAMGRRIVDLELERAELERERDEARGCAAKLKTSFDLAIKDTADHRQQVSDLKARQRELVEAATQERHAQFVRERSALMEELEAARSGPARRQPWHNPEGSPAERARAQLQDAIHHIQRDGEIGLARICATYAVEILYLQRDPCPMPRSLRDLEIVGRRLRDISGQMDVIIDGAGVPLAVREHARLIKLDAEKARAELRGEDWKNG